MSDKASGGEGTERRGFLTGGLMAAGLVGGYGAAGAIGARYLFPATDRARAWLFVARADELSDGASVSYRSPSGQRIAIARQGSSGTLDDFVALSSTCPHLGCQVHWESQNDRFFCPCHNGSFDPAGKPTGGPPLEANQELPRFPLRLQEGLLYIQVPVENLSRAIAMERVEPSTQAGPGHDPCLEGRPRGEQA